VAPKKAHHPPYMRDERHRDGEKHRERKTETQRERVLLDMYFTAIHVSPGC